MNHESSFDLYVMSGALAGPWEVRLKADTTYKCKAL